MTCIVDIGFKTDDFDFEADILDDAKIMDCSMD